MKYNIPNMMVKMRDDTKARIVLAFDKSANGLEDSTLAISAASAPNIAP
jgi:hypothetical protein